ncbi:hypothetical protein SADUNF_Sadunf06G0120900 [Salix dunnii]|uniref:Uncharacterized protein n=1 Tax=Salix dunnii TaxID=1413687 RepID=A0A835MX09_9ROSI|nr:hypothetical protein SADUNF_Sadunf06G0120900 [Salix dunnii]
MDDPYIVSNGFTDKAEGPAFYLNCKPHNTFSHTGVEITCDYASVSKIIELYVKIPPVDLPSIMLK